MEAIRMPRILLHNEFKANEQLPEATELRHIKLFSSSG